MLVNPPCRGLVSASKTLRHDRGPYLYLPARDSAANATADAHSLDY